MRSTVATALLAISIALPAVAQYDGTSWGMHLSEVQKLFPKGDVIRGESERTIYTALVSPAGLPKCNAVFDFDSSGGLAEVNLYFPETHSARDLANLLSLLRGHLTRKHGPPTAEGSERGGFWILRDGSVVLLAVARSAYGGMVPGILYSPTSTNQGYAPSDHPGYDKTTWGMPAERVRQTYPNGVLAKQENGRLQYRVVLPVGPADSALAFFDFDDRRQLSRVSILFPKQGTPIDLRSTMITRSTKEYGEQLFELLRVEMIKKYGPPSVTKGGLTWLTQHGDAIGLLLAVDSGFATPSLVYQPAGTDRTRGL